MIKAVLFDLDGTLVNSLDDLATSTNYALEKFGFPKHETEKYKYFVGNGMQNLIMRALPEDGRDSETREKVFKAFWNHYAEHYVDKTVPYEGIEELLKALKEDGKKIAIISNKAQEMAVTVAEKIFGDIFDMICGKQDGYPAKPDPSLTLKVMEDIGVKPCECVLIGDSGMDAAAAVNAKCTGIGVLWGFRTEDELRSNGAKYIVSKPAEIMDILKNI